MAERWHYSIKDNQVIATAHGEAMGDFIHQACAELAHLCLNQEEHWIIQSLRTETLVKLHEMVEAELRKRAVEV